MSVGIKNRTSNQGILNMDNQKKKLAQVILAQVINEVSHQYFIVDGLKGMSLDKANDELLSSVITHLMIAQSELNKYVIDTKLTQKAND